MIEHSDVAFSIFCAFALALFMLAALFNNPVLLLIGIGGLIVYAIYGMVCVFVDNGRF